MLAPSLCLLTFINIQDLASYLHELRIGHEFIQLAIAIAATDESRCVPSLISASVQLTVHGTRPAWSLPAS